MSTVVAMPPVKPGVPGTPSASPAAPAAVEFRYTQTESFVALLHELGASLLVSTYQANKLLVVRAAGDGLSTLVRTFDQPMGLAVGARRLALGEAAPYAVPPWFWSDQGELKLQIAGLTHGADRRVVAPADAGKLVVLSLAGDRLVAVETVNAPAPHMATRRLLAGPPLGLAEIEAAGFDLPRLAKQRAAA